MEDPVVTRGDERGSGTAMERICLLGQKLATWDGGVEYLRLCAAGLKAACPELKIDVLIPEKDAPGKLLLMKRAIAIGAGLEGVSLHTYADSEEALAETAGRLGCAAVFPALTSLGEEFPLPWVAYIPDLQDKHLPENFHPERLPIIDERNARLLREARVLSMNSHAAAEDVRRFYPEARCEVFVLPFAPIAGEGWFEADLRAAREKYRLPRRFFLVSNRFWLHKAHGTAFEALKLLREMPGCGDVELVCTGSVVDPRWPEYFPGLKRRIEELGSTEQIRILDWVPRLDQIAIMRQAEAVVQPSTFEGGPGGGSVYDAVAVGTRVIASDIAVNREIVDGSVRFFRVGSAEELAREMFATLQCEYDRPSVEELMQRGEAARRAFGGQILKAVERAVELHGAAGRKEGFRYRISGLGVSCDVELAAAMKLEGAGDVDVVIRAGRVPEHLEEAQHRSERAEATAGTLLFRLEGVGSFLVREGREIVYDVASGARPRGVALYLMGSCFAALLQQRGNLVMHGSAVSVQGRAVVFCGAAGAGKSTMAAMLCRLGHPLLNDDVCNFARMEDGSLWVQPDSRKLKLWSETLGRLAWPDGKSEAVTDDMAKYFCEPLLSETGPRPLAAVYMLREADEGEPPQVRRLPVLEAMAELQRNVYRPFLANAMGLEQRYFEAFAWLQRCAGVYELRRAKDFGGAEGLVAVLKEHWKMLTEIDTMRALQ